MGIRRGAWRNVDTGIKVLHKVSKSTVGREVQMEYHLGWDRGESVVTEISFTTKARKLT